MEQLIAHLFGDYIFQSDWMAQNKTKRSWPAFVHALLYSLCFLPLCWVAMTLVQHPDICVTFLDKSGAETTCVEPGTRAPDGAAGYLVYSAPTSKIIPAHFRWLPWLVIFGTHFLIDRFRLARYVVWAKNWVGPWKRVLRGTDADPLNELEPHYEWQGPNARWPYCDKTGYPEGVPIWLSTWLLIIADNACHLAINYAALRWL